MSGTTSRRIAGVTACTIDGDAWDVADSCEYSPSTVARETVKGLTAVEGYSEIPQQGYISFQLRDRGDATVYSLNGKTNSTIIVQLANNKVVYAYGAWQTGEIGVETKEGTFSIKFESANVVESTVS